MARRSTARWRTLAATTVVGLGPVGLLGCGGTGEKTCADFESQQDAQAYYAGLDPYGSHPLDADADGTACEELPRRPPTREEFAADFCATTPDAPAPIAFVGTVRAVADDTEYYRQVTFDVTEWYTADRGPRSHSPSR